MAKIGFFEVPDYFITGEIMRGEHVSAKDRISDANLVADCLTICAAGKLFELSDTTKNTLENAAKILGMHFFEPPLPATGEGFIEYAHRTMIID